MKVNDILRDYPPPEPPAPPNSAPARRARRPVPKWVWMILLAGFGWSWWATTHGLSVVPDALREKLPSLSGLSIARESPWWAGEFIPDTDKEVTLLRLVSGEDGIRGELRVARDEGKFEAVAPVRGVGGPDATLLYTAKLTPFRKYGGGFEAGTTCWLMVRTPGGAVLYRTDEPPANDAGVPLIPAVRDAARHHTKVATLTKRERGKP